MKGSNEPLLDWWEGSQGYVYQMSVLHILCLEGVMMKGTHPQNSLFWHIKQEWVLLWQNFHFLKWNHSRTNQIWSIIYVTQPTTLKTPNCVLNKRTKVLAVLYNNKHTSGQHRVTKHQTSFEFYEKNQFVIKHNSKAWGYYKVVPFTIIQSMT